MAKQADIYRMPGHLIRRLNQISTAVFQDRMKDRGLTLTSVQFAAMTALHAHPGIDQASLAGLIAYDRATIGGVVDRLETRGLVSRKVSATDRRGREVRLTPQGEALLAELTPVVRALQDDILPGLTPKERAQFIALAAKAAKAGNSLSRAPLSALPAADGD